MQRIDKNLNTGCAGRPRNILSKNLDHNSNPIECNEGLLEAVCAGHTAQQLNDFRRYTRSL